MFDYHHSLKLISLVEAYENMMKEQLDCNYIKQSYLIRLKNLIKLIIQRRN